MESLFADFLISVLNGIGLSLLFVLAFALALLAIAFFLLQEGK